MSSPDGESAPATLSYAAALVAALDDALASDARVSIIGTSILGLGSHRGLLQRLHQAYPDRIVPPPIAEASLAAIGAGAAMAGARPFVDFGAAAFSYLAWSQLVNEAAVAHYMSGGRLTVPVTYHALHGVRGAGGPQHSHSPQAMLCNAPGLEIVVPSTAADVYGLLRTALASPNPTFILSHARLLGIEGPMPRERAPIPFGRAEIKRRGRDITIVATSLMVHYALAAADMLSRDGIEAEIVDPRTLVPLDEATILDSLAHTGRLVVVDETSLRAGVASDIAGMIAERGFHLLKAPVARVGRADVPVPYSKPLEEAVTPDPAAIAAAARRVLGA
jgi:acetoin:2,6-dichlorophenolindophenol oxidoreductase subunit beta